MRTYVEYPKVTETRAGIALTHNAKGNPLLSVALVNGPPDDGVFAAPTEHELPDSTPGTLASALSRLLTTPTSIVLSLPVADTREHQNLYHNAVRELPGMELWHSLDHSAAYLIDIVKTFQVEPEQEFYILFLDLSSPGQPAAKRYIVESDDGKPLFFTEDKSVKDTALDAIDELVTPKIQALLHAIYILSPPDGSGVGVGLEVLVSTLKTKYPETKLQFATLAEVSLCAAAFREQEQGVKTMRISCPDLTPLALRVALANGHRVVCVARMRAMPLEKIVEFTTVDENQTSATLEFFYGDCSLGTVVLRGLGTAWPRIQVSILMDDEGETSVCVQEVGTENQVVSNMNVGLLHKDEIERYINAHGTGGEGREAPAGGVLGALPA